MAFEAVGVSRVGVRLRGCVVGVGLYLLVGGFGLRCLSVVGVSAGGAVELLLVGSRLKGSASELAFAVMLESVLASVLELVLASVLELVLGSVLELVLGSVLVFEVECVGRVSVYTAVTAKRSVRWWFSCASSESKKDGDEDVVAEKEGRTQERLGPWCG